MFHLFKKIKKKVNGLIITFTCTGIILVILGFLIVWTDFVLKLVIGLLTVVLAYTFFYLAYKLHHIKKEVEKHLSFKKK